MAEQSDIAVVTARTDQAALRAVYEQCRRITKDRARNFYYAFITLPKPQRRAIYAAYAFCRHSDDIADEALSLDQKVAALRDYRERLARAYAGQPDSPVFLALMDAAQHYRIPQEHFQEIISGVEMDLNVRRYQTFDDLRLYCYRVASAVGLVCIQVFGYTDPQARDYAIDMGVAMQLTNILRDLKEDAGRDRIYLPQEDLRRFGYTEEMLFGSEVNDAFRGLMQFQVERARRYFANAKRLPPLLAPRSRPCVAVLGGLYSGILDKIGRRGYHVYHRRIGLSTPRKVLLTGQLWALSLLGQLRHPRSSS